MLKNSSVRHPERGEGSTLIAILPKYRVITEFIISTFETAISAYCYPKSMIFWFY